MVMSCDNEVQWNRWFALIGAALRGEVQRIEKKIVVEEEKILAKELAPAHVHKTSVQHEVFISVHYLSICTTRTYPHFFFLR